MNKLFKTLSLLAVLAFVAAACIPQVVDVAQAAPANAGDYQVTLGKSVGDRDVADFINSNSCTQISSFHICEPAGLALWADEDQIVRTAYLYVNDSGSFAAYRGELPFSLQAGDTMADVEEKLGQRKVEHAPQAGWVPGLPDQSLFPDRTHYWAVYERFGVTVIYNTLSASDKDASLYAILVSK